MDRTNSFVEWLLFPLALVGSRREEEQVAGTGEGGDGVRGCRLVLVMSVRDGRQYSSLTVPSLPSLPQTLTEHAPPLNSFSIASPSPLLSSPVCSASARPTR
jgi:hypothetical protein